MGASVPPKGWTPHGAPDRGPEGVREGRLGLAPSLRDSVGEAGLHTPPTAGGSPPGQSPGCSSLGAGRTRVHGAELALEGVNWNEAGQPPPSRGWQGLGTDRGAPSPGGTRREGSAGLAQAPDSRFWVLGLMPGWWARLPTPECQPAPSGAGGEAGGGMKANDIYRPYMCRSKPRVSFGSRYQKQSLSELKRNCR